MAISILVFDFLSISTFDLRHSPLPLTLCNSRVLRSRTGIVTYYIKFQPVNENRVLDLIFIDIALDVDNMAAYGRDEYGIQVS